MPISTEEQNVQTDDWTQEKAINTDDSWEPLMHALLEQSSSLAKEFASLEKQQVDEESEYKSQRERLEKIRDDKLRQHRALLEKTESVQVKLNLNSSKTTRKNFSAKVEEFSRERDLKREGKKKLNQELEKLDERLKLLTEEQRNETQSWEQEISVLQQEMERFSTQVKESNKVALMDERAAFESQRDLAVSQVEDWILEAKRYLGTLRSDNSPQNNQHRLEWENNLATICNSLGKLQASYDESRKLLLQGKQLDSLPQIPLPLLPHIPMIDLLYFTPPPPAVKNPLSFMPRALEQNTTVPRQMVPTSIRAHSVSHIHRQYPIPYSLVPAPLSDLTPGAEFATSVRNPASQTVPSGPQPAGKLDKLLEILSTQFPQCSRDQIMGVMQQVKSERGTMAGLSIEDIKQQVEQKLVQNKRLATPFVRKQCLICQNQVEPGSQYDTHCPHTLHKECISVWLKTKNSCPYCSTK